MRDFANATALTLDAYQHIADHYAATHTRANIPDFWRDRLKRLAGNLGNKG